MCDRGDAVAHGQIAEIEEAGDGAEERRSGGAEEWRSGHGGRDYHRRAR